MDDTIKKVYINGQLVTSNKNCSKIAGAAYAAAIKVITKATTSEIAFLSEGHQMSFEGKDWQLTGDKLIVSDSGSKIVVAGHDWTHRLRQYAVVIRQRKIQQREDDLTEAIVSWLRD